MKRHLRSRGPWLAWIAAFAASLSGGCARLVTLSPEQVSARNDDGWRMRAPATPSAVATPPGAVVPLPHGPDVGSAGGETRASYGEPSVTAEVPGAAPAASASPTAPQLFRDRPEIERARRSSPDGYGVPVDLYSVDPLLAAHRQEMESRASSRRSVATGMIIFGLLCGAIGASAIAYGQSHTGSGNQRTQDSADQAIGYGTISVVLSLGEIIAGTALALTSSDSSSLHRYFQETYGDKR